MKKSTFLLIVILFVIAISALCSCSNREPSGNRIVRSTVNDSVLFRAKIIYSIGNEFSFVKSLTQLIKVPLGNLPGDTILLNDKVYLLGTIVQRINSK